MSISILDEVRVKLKNIKESVEDRTIEKETIDDFRQICSVLDSNSKYFDSIIYEIFRGSNCLPAIVSQIVRQSENHDCLTRCFTCIELLLELISEKSCETLISPLLCTILPVIANQSLKSKRADAYNPLCTLITICGNFGVDAELVQISNLIDFCYSQIEDYKKLEDSVKKGLFSLIGCLFRFYHESVKSRPKYAPIFIKVVVGDLLSNMNSNLKSPSYSVLEGCINALNSFLFVCPEDVMSHNKMSDREVYTIVRRICCEGEEATRLAPRKAALNLFATHATLFAQYSYHEFQVWYSSLINLCKKVGEIKYLSLKALDAFFRELSILLDQKMEDERKSVQNIVNYFIGQFAISFNNNRNINDVAQAAKCYGFISKACRTIFGHENVIETLRTICNLAHSRLFNSTEPIETNLGFVPQFCDSFSYILMNLDKVPEEIWISVESIILLWLEHFPTVNNKYLYGYGLVIHRFVLSAAQINTTFVSKLVEKLLKQICALPPKLASNNELLTERNVHIFTVDYLPLWNIWMKPFFKELLCDGYSKEVCVCVCESLLENSMNSAMKIVNILNFDAVNNEIDVDSVFMHKLTAAKPNDFCIFINLVDFLQNLMPSLPEDRIILWLPRLITHFVELSTKYPLVSGFYKLLTACLKCFENSVKRPGELQAKCGLSDQLCNLCNKFTSEILGRINDLKDDLLVSCLTFILHLPTEIIQNKLIDISKALKISLTLGLSYLPLANVCMDSLESWSKSMSIQTLTPLFKIVLPVFDQYLRTEKFEETDSGRIVDDFAVSAKTKAGWSMIKRRARNITNANHKSTATQNAQLTNIRRRMAIFIGSLGGEIGQNILDLDSDKWIEDRVNWDMNTKIEYRIPFRDVKPVINLDTFLPRVCKLAVFCGDRPTKVAACELLHSVVVFIVGQQGTSPMDNKNNMTQVYKRVMPIVLKLACDVEEVARQLFDCLSMQIIHYFTAHQTYENRDTITLLDCILEGMMDENASLRDHCAKCLTEFVKWSFKQTSPNQTSKSNDTMKSVVKRLYNFAAHADYKKRLAAAMGFNAIYRQIREKWETVNIFVFEILVNFMHSLSLAHYDTNANGASNECCVAIDHIERIITEETYIKKLYINDTNRKIPLGWESATISECIKWLVKNCGKPQRKFREKCLGLMVGLSKAMQGANIGHGKPVVDFMKSKGISFVIETFESPLLTKCGSDFVCSTDLILWIESLQSSLDSHTFCIDRQWILGNEFTKIMKHTKLFTALNVFYDVINEKNYKVDASPTERLQIERKLSMAMISVMAFVNTLINLFENDETQLKKSLQSVDLEKLCHMILNIMMKPEDINFDGIDSECSNLFNIILNRFLFTISKCKVHQLFQSVFEKCTKKRNLLLPSPKIFLEDYQISDSTSICRKIDAYSTLISKNILKIDGQILDSLMGILFDSCFYFDGKTRIWGPDLTEIAQKMMTLILQSGNGVECCIVHKIMDSTLVQNSVTESHKKLVTKGEIFRQRFVPQISEAFARNPTNILKEFVNKYASQSLLFGQWLKNVVQFIANDSKLRKSYGNSLCTTILCELQLILESWSFGVEETQMLWIDLMKCLALFDTSFYRNINHPQFNTVFNSYLNILDSNLELQKKNKALHLLGAFSSAPNESIYLNKLMESLNNLVSNYFPLTSAEIEKGSQFEEIYKESLIQFIYGLSASDNVNILHLLTALLCRENNHILGDKMQQWFNNYMKKVKISLQEPLLKVPLDLFFTEGKGIVSDQLRLNCVSKVLIPMLRGLKCNNLLTFYLCDDRVKKFMAILATPFVKCDPSKYHTLLHRKLGVMLILQVMFDCLPAENLKGALNESFSQNSDPKTLLRQVLAFVRDIGRKEGFADGELRDLKFDFRCESQNLFIAAIKGTQQSSANLYCNAFKQDILEMISKPEEFEYFFADVLEDKLATKSLSTVINQKGGRNVEFEDEEKGSKLHFLASQTLQSSSLADFDFTNAHVINTSHANTSNDIHTEFVPETSNETIVELDDLNLHACMPNYLAMVQYAAQKEIGYDKYNKEIPTWMKEMRDRLAKCFLSLNIKLFIARIITTLPEIFAPYARQFLVPLMNLVVSERLGNNMNYFRVDVIVTLIAWHVIPESAEEKEACANLLDIIVCLSESHDSTVLKRNIELVRNLCVRWKNALPSYLNTRYILDTVISAKDVQIMSTKVKTAHKLAGVLMQNKIAPFPNIGVEDKKPAFFMKLLKFVDSTSSTVFKPAAEVIGITFAYLETEKIDFAPLFDATQRKLESFGSTKGATKKDKGKLMKCLCLIVEKYPKFAEKFKDQSLEGLLCHGEIKSNSLLILEAVASSNKAQGLFGDIKNMMPNFDTSDYSQQQSMVKIVANLVLKQCIKPADLLQYLTTVLKMCTNSESGQTKFTALELCILIMKSSDIKEYQSKDMLLLAKRCIITCLNDQQDFIRQRALAFWCTDANLSESTGQRITQLFTRAYDTNSEGEFLSYATYILLERCANSPDFTQPIFDRDLIKDCQFQNMRITTNWKNRYSSMQTPLFAESQLFTESATKSTQLAAEFTSVNNTNRIMATQNFGIFSQTQTQFTDWMSQATFDPNVISQQSNQTSQSQTIGSFRAEVKGQLGQNSTLGFSQKNEDDSIMRLKRRIVKDRQKDQIGNFVQMANRRRIDREKASEENREGKGQRVQLYRNYKQGEIPDIKIPHSAIIAPLQALAQHDSIIASCLFESLLSAIYCADSSCMKMDDVLDAVLENTTQANAHFITAILTFCLHQSHSEKRVNFDPEKVCRVAILANEQHLAIALIENAIKTVQREIIPLPAKRAKTFANCDLESLWISLARLYKSIGDFDQTRCIFSCHLNCLDSTRMGLKEERMGRFKDAIECYTLALTQQSSGFDNTFDQLQQAEQDFLEQSRFKCLNFLNDWSNLAQVALINCDSQTQNISGPLSMERLWVKEENDVTLRDTHLPYALRAHVKLMQNGNANMAKRTLNELAGLVSKWMDDKEKRHWLQANQPCELAWISLCDAKLEHCMDCCNVAIDSFLANWCELNPGYRSLRLDYLQQLQSIAEMQHFIKCIKGQNDLSFCDLLTSQRSLSNICRGNPTNNRNATPHWEDVIMNRSMFVEHLKSDLISQNNEDEIYLKFLPMEIEFRLKYCDAARKSGNIAVARQQLDLCKVLGSPIHSGVWTEYELSLGETLREEYKQSSHPLSMHSLCDVINKCIPNVTIDNRFGSLAGQILADISFKLNDWQDSLTVDDRQKLMELNSKLGGNKMQTWDTQSLCTEFKDRAFETMIKCVNYGETHSESLMILFNLCDKLIQKWNNQEISLSSSQIDEYSINLVDCLLRALNFGVAHSESCIPRLFTIIENHSNTRQIFIDQICRISCWKFLPWSQQMMAFLSLDFGYCVLDILQQMATQFPNAFLYSVRLLFDIASFDLQKLKDHKCKKLIQRLMQLSKSSRIANEFLEALSFLDDHLNFLSQFDSNTRTCKENGEKSGKSWIRLFLWDLFRIPQFAEREIIALPGDLFLDLRKHLLPEFEAKFGVGGTKLQSLKGDLLKQQLNSFKDKLAAYCLKRSAPNLMLYSPWFKQFNQATRETLEIPGQYSGLEKPNPKYHVTVVGFDERLKVMNSLRKPKVIKVRGNDGKEYNYLVKSGEDLRQDERIMQFINLYNNVLKQDSTSSQSKYKVQTYSVIPLTLNIGLIEFVGETMTLKDIIDNNKTENERTDLSTKNIYKRFMKLNDCQNACSYHTWFLNDSPKEAGNKMRNVQKSFNDELLKSCIFKLAAQPKDFMVLRNGFMQSYACMSIVHYILGVGDRHLKNSLMHLKSARIIGIDFGYAFGAGLMLPIPEIPPIRLTNQIIQVFGPVGCHGEFEACMRHCMKIVRENTQLLLNTMDIFVKEPSLDWMDAVKRQQNQQMRLGLNLEERHKYSQIAIARRKLLGDNPAQIICDEVHFNQYLNRNINQCDVLKNIKLTLIGCDDNRPITELEQKPRDYQKTGLNTNQQIKCLIDLSTDVRIYARVYAGYEPWM